MSAGDIHSILYRGSDPLQSAAKPRYDPTKKLTRLWPGKIPEYATKAGSLDSDQDEDDVPFEDEHEPLIVNTAIQDRRLELIRQAAAEGKDDSADVVERVRRRRALRETVILEATDEQSGERSPKRRYREAAEPEILCARDDAAQDTLAATATARVVDWDKDGAAPSSMDVADDDEVAARRRQLREAALAARLEEEQKLAEQEAKEEEETDVSSEYESDLDDGFEDGDASRHALKKPCFVPKAQRDTIREREQAEAEEERRAEEQKNHLAERKKASQSMLVERIRQEEAEEILALQRGALGDPEIDMPDDSDDKNEAEEYELWKIRELRRIKRDREEREERQRFLAEVQTRRLMTEEERREDDKRLDALHPELPKGQKYAFMQKYYHPGAFFQDEKFSGAQPLYQRDFNVPVGEDSLDKKVLPSVMRLRRGEFGRAGQVKHTHLADVDTTDFTTPWYQNDKLSIRNQTKMAGIKGSTSFTRPSARK